MLDLRVDPGLGRRELGLQLLQLGLVLLLPLERLLLLRLGRRQVVLLLLLGGQQRCQGVALRRQLVAFGLDLRPLGTQLLDQ